MGQSETGYIREKLVRLRVEGQLARRDGISSAANPYLHRDFMPSQSGISEQAWFNSCDAWWRGWDAEDRFRRGVA